MNSNPRQTQGGFTYLLLLIMLSILALSLLKSSDGSRMRHRQQQEAELLFRGEQIRAAIDAYRKQGDGCFPSDFSQLLIDSREATTHYHLRQRYSDPMTHRPWIRMYDAEGRWIGVHSSASGTPRRKVGFGPEAVKFASAKSFQDWEFSVEPQPLAPLPAACHG